VVREGNSLHVINNPQVVANAAAHTYHRIFECQPFQRADRLGGLILGEVGDRNVSLTTGEIYDGMNEFIIPDQNTAASNTFSAYYRDGNSGFTKEAASTQWSNTLYDDGSGSLATLGNNKWAVQWLYIGPDGSMALVYGRTEANTQIGAEDAAMPNTLPLHLQVHGKIVGRFIFQKGGLTAEEVQSAFVTTFSAMGVSSHNELANLQGGQLTEYFHLTAAELAYLTDHDANHVDGSDSIRDSSNSQNGLATSSQVTKLDSLASDFSIDLYVRAVDGNDNNVGSTAAPLATLQAAIDKIPHIVNDLVVIHIGPDGGTPYDFPLIANRVLNANVYLICDGADSGDGFTDLLSSTAALACSDFNVVKTSGLTPNEYQGKTIEILTGAATGDRRTIRDNDATDIVPCATFSASVAEDDTYRILEPAIEASIDTVAGDEWTSPFIIGIGHGHYHSGSQALSKDLKKLWLVNLRLVTGYTLNIVNSSVECCGVELASPLGTVALPESRVLCGYEAANSAAYGDSVNSPVVDLGVASITSWLGWGLYVITDAAVSLGMLAGFFVISGSFTIGNKAQVSMKGGHITDGIKNLVAYGPSDSYFYSHAAEHPIVQIGGNPCVKITNGWLALVYVNLYSAGNGVEVQEFGKVLGVGITGSVGGIGVLTRLGGQYESDSDLRIDGTVGDFSEDNGVTVRDKATLTVNTAFVDAAHGRIFRAGS